MATRKKKAPKKFNRRKYITAVNEIARQLAAHVREDMQRNPHVQYGLFSQFLSTRHIEETTYDIEERVKKLLTS